MVLLYVAAFLGINSQILIAAADDFVPKNYEDVLELISQTRRSIVSRDRGETESIAETPSLRSVPHTGASSSASSDWRRATYSSDSVVRTFTFGDSRTEASSAISGDSVFTLYRPRSLKVAPDLGWKLHITAQYDPLAVDKVLCSVVPFLLERDALFKIPCSFDAYARLFSSETQGGKLITIYPCRGEDGDRLERFVQDLDGYLMDQIHKMILNKKMFLPLIHEMQIGESSGLYARYGSCSGHGRGLEEDRLTPWPSEYHLDILKNRPFEALNPKLYTVGCLWNSWIPFSKLYPLPKTAKIKPAELTMEDVGTPMTDCSEVEELD
jgi:hypothetical protein